MPQLIVRNLERDVKARLKQRAQRHGHSMEEEARDILRNAVRSEHAVRTRLGSRLRARFADLGLEEEIVEIRGQKARSARFEE
jgi:plasmid stability protein